VSSLRSNHTRRYSALIAPLVLCWSLAPCELRAQEQTSFRALTVVAGPANYDLAGTGWSWSAAARLDLPLAHVLMVEPGVGFFTYDAQFGDRFTYLLPEVSLQLQYPGHRIRPYVGIGGGAAFLLQGQGDSEPSVHAAVGLRAAVGSGWGIRGEGRVRNITVFQANNSILEFGVGLSRHF
jgi:hypothetical protein